jgi:hypothetical protein
VPQDGTTPRSSSPPTRRAPTSSSPRALATAVTTPNGSTWYYDAIPSWGHQAGAMRSTASTATEIPSATRAAPSTRRSACVGTQERARSRPVGDAARHKT